MARSGLLAALFMHRSLVTARRTV